MGELFTISGIVCCNFWGISHQLKHFVLLDLSVLKIGTQSSTAKWATPTANWPQYFPCSQCTSYRPVDQGRTSGSPGMRQEHSPLCPLLSSIWERQKRRQVRKTCHQEWRYRGWGRRGSLHLDNRSRKEWNGGFKSERIITSATISIDLAVVRMMYQVGLMHYNCQWNCISFKLEKNEKWINFSKK